MVSLKMFFAGAAIAATATAGYVLAAPVDPEPTEPSVDEISDLVALHRSTIASRLDRDLAGSLDVVVHSGSGSSGGSRSESGCRLDLFPEAMADVSVDVAHHVLRCFQLDLVDTTEPWVLAGQAHFYDDLVAGEALAATAHHTAFVCDPTTALPDRTESAVTVFATMDALGIDPWTRFDPMLVAGGGEAPIAAMGAEPIDTLERLSTMVALDAGFGPEWSFDALGRPTSSCLVEEFVEPESSATFGDEVGSFGVMVPRAVTARGEVLHIEVVGDAGAVAPDGGPSRSVRASETVTYCVATEPCRCPDGTTVGEFTGPTTFAVGLGSLAGGTVGATFETTTTEEACSPSPWMRIELDGETHELRGGLCFLDDAGFLQGAFGYVASWDAQRQDGPHPEAVAGLLSEPIEGTRLGASVFLALTGGSTHQFSPVVSLDPELSGGTFSGAGLAGSFWCGALQDPSAPSVGS